MKSCFFIGHRDAPEGIMPALAEAVERHIMEFGVCEFVVGHYGSFDRMAARAVIYAKQKHLEVRLYLLLPYHPAEKPVEPPAGVDGTFYPPGMENVPRRFAIDRANRYMIAHTDYLIAYAAHPGKARDIYQLAKRKSAKRLTLRWKNDNTTGQEFGLQCFCVNKRTIVIAASLTALPDSIKNSRTR